MKLSMMLIFFAFDMLTVVIIVALFNKITQKGIYKAIIYSVVLSAPISGIFAVQVFAVEGYQILKLWVLASLIHLLLGGLFFHLMTLPDRSLALRMLVELRKAPEKMLTIKQMEDVYNLEDMIVSRLKQLADENYITINGHSVKLKKKGEYLGRFINLGRRLFNITSAN